MFWDIKPCASFKVNRRFEVTCRLQQTVLATCFTLVSSLTYSWFLKMKATTLWYLLHAGFLLGLFFDPEDSGDMFLRNIG
jgi:hypothetical protein